VRMWELTASRGSRPSHSISENGDFRAQALPISRNKARCFPPDIPR
jgi:hypothetical protein